jgi:hypothetical protein
MTVSVVTAAHLEAHTEADLVRFDTALQVRVLPPAHPTLHLPHTHIPSHHPPPPHPPSRCPRPCPARKTQSGVRCVRRGRARRPRPGALGWTQAVSPNPHRALWPPPPPAGWPTIGPAAVHKGLFTGSELTRCGRMRGGGRRRGCGLLAAAAAAAAAADSQLSVLHTMLFQDFQVRASDPDPGGARRRLCAGQCYRSTATECSDQRQITATRDRCKGRAAG